MERNDDHNIDPLIDLGSVVEETKGGAMGDGDTFNSLRQGGLGLDDD
ncbi:benenodin family lasso peptide [Sphingobium sp. PNB]|nr:benenodin family lasso peptide [Sphingobium sp. PNB]MCB4861615.1 benenodin family lasso peptide [Sphingobium sp. PNB]